MAVMYGKTMIARISPAERIPWPDAGLSIPNDWNNQSTAGATKNRPQNPNTTLGMAASSSDRNEQVRRTHAGATSDRKAAVPTPSGTAISMAMADVANVP